MKARPASHRPTGDYRRNTPLRIVCLLFAAMCFTQVVSTQHIHALDDIDQTCLNCRLSDNQDMLAPVTVEVITFRQFPEHQNERRASLYIGASFDYEARAPPFFSYD
jgi:hypothetical protein